MDILHALDVAARAGGPLSDEQLAGLLHDALEDGDLLLAELAAAGVGEAVVSAVAVVSRRMGETYTEYIDRVAASGDELARRVKVADLQANLARSDPLHASLRPRYERALRVLEAAT